MAWKHLDSRSLRESNATPRRYPRLATITFSYFYHIDAGRVWIFCSGTKSRWRDEACPSARVVKGSLKVKAIGDIATIVGRKRNKRRDTEIKSSLLQNYFVPFQFYLALAGRRPTGGSGRSPS